MLTRTRTGKLDIIEPRYHDNKVLLAVYKIMGKNKVKILRGAYKGTYEISGIAATSYPVESNGVIPCYAVPIDKLRRIK